MTCYIINRKADDFKTSGFSCRRCLCLLLFLCLDCLLRLRPLWLVCCLCLVRSVCVCVCSAVPVLGHPLLRLRLHLLCLYFVRILCGSSAVCVAGLSTLFTSSMPCPFRLRLRLLCLCFVRVFYGSSASATPVPVPASFFYCVSIIGFFFYFYLVSLNQGHLCQVRS